MSMYVIDFNSSSIFAVADLLCCYRSLVHLQPLPVSCLVSISAVTLELSAPGSKYSNKHSPVQFSQARQCRYIRLDTKSISTIQTIFFKEASMLLSAPAVS